MVAMVAMNPLSPRSPWARYGALLALALLDGLVPGVASPQAVLASLGPHATMWIAIHLLQVPVVALLAVVLWPMLAEGSGRWSLAGRIGLVCFALASGAVAATQALGLGALVAYATTQPASAQVVLSAMIDALWVNRLLGMLAFVGAAGWLVALLALVSIRARSLLVDSLVPLTLALGLAVGFSGLVEGEANTAYWLGALAVAALLVCAARPRLPLALVAFAALLGTSGLVAGIGALAPLCLAAGLALLEPRVVALTPTEMRPLVEAGTDPAGHARPTSAAKRPEGEGVAGRAGRVVAKRTSPGQARRR